MKHATPEPTPNHVKKPPLSRIILWALIFLTAAFCLGFGGYGLFLTVVQTRTTTDSSAELVSPPASQLGEHSTQRNPVGSHTQKSFPGLTLSPVPEYTEPLSPEEIYGQVAPSLCAVAAQQDGVYLPTGTAIAVTSDGYLLTTASVADFSRETLLQVTLPDGKVFPASVVGLDASTDIAVLKVDTTLTPAPLGQLGTLSIGSALYAVTTEGAVTQGSVLTRGIVSALERQVQYNGVTVAALQSDATVAATGTGGALCNQYGQVVAVAVSSEDVTGATGVGSFGLPIQTMTTSVKELIRQGYISGRPRLGITGTTLTAQEAVAYGAKAGVIIYSFADPTAFGEDVVVGDIITQIGDTTISSMADITPALSRFQPGDTVTVTVAHQEEDGTFVDKTTQVTLLSDEGQTQG